MSVARENGATEDGSDIRSWEDLDLVRRVREGGHMAAEAYAELYRRHHGPAVRTATRIAGADGPDIAAEAFAKLLEVLVDGRGPDQHFRPYLIRTVHNLCIDRRRLNAREHLVADLEDNDESLAIGDGAAERWEQGTAARAFNELPPRWRTVLWHRAVEGRTTAETAELLGMNANAVAALTFRARDGLRRGYLLAHLNPHGDPRCLKLVEAMVRHVQGALRGARRRALDKHLLGCGRCTAAVTELTEIESNLNGLLVAAPAATLGAGAVAFLKGVGVKFLGAAALVSGVATATWIDNPVAPDGWSIPAMAADTTQPSPKITWAPLGDESHLAVAVVTRPTALRAIEIAVDRATTWRSMGSTWSCHSVTTPPIRALASIEAKLLLHCVPVRRLTAATTLELDLGIANPSEQVRVVKIRA